MVLILTMEHAKTWKNTSSGALTTLRISALDVAWVMVMSRSYRAPGVARPEARTSRPGEGAVGGMACRRQGIADRR